MTPRTSRAQLAKNGSKGFTHGMESLDTGPWREEAFRREDGVLQCPVRAARGYGWGETFAVNEMVSVHAVRGVVLS